MHFIGALGEAFNYQRGLRIHYKLTKEHIELTGANKIRNKQDKDVLSKSVLYLMQIYQFTSDYQESFSNNRILENTFVEVDFFLAQGSFLLCRINGFLNYQAF